MKDYKAKAEFYVRQHQDHAAIAKLRSNIPLTADDVSELEEILWSEVGSCQDYEAEFGKKSLGEFVREIVGMDMNAAKQAFAQYLDQVNLDNRQIYLVNQIIEYIVRNGMMKEYRAKWNDEGLVCPARGSIYRSRQYCGGIYRSFVVGGYQADHRSDQCQCSSIV